MWKILIHIYLSIGLLCSGFNTLVVTYQRDNEYKAMNLWEKIQTVIAGIIAGCLNVVLWPHMASGLVVIARILKHDERTIDHMRRILNNDEL